MITMKDSFGVTTDNDLDLFEKKYKVKLHIEYRSFLKKQNGGIADLGGIDIPGWGESQVNIFNGLNLDGNRGKNYGLDEVISRFQDRFPSREVIIIANDSGGNKFLLGVNFNRFGKIYFWDHESWDDEADDCLPELIELANSFDEFIAKMS